MATSKADELMADDPLAAVPERVGLAGNPARDGEASARSTGLDLRTS